MRVHRLDRKSRARLPRVRVYVSRTSAAKESGPTRRRLTENALHGGDAVLRTEGHGQEQGFPSDDEKVGGEGLSSHEVGAQKGELHGGTSGCSAACVRVDEHLH
jgi:hypothetical protein